MTKSPGPTAASVRISSTMDHGVATNGAADSVHQARVAAIAGSAASAPTKRRLRPSGRTGMRDTSVFLRRIDRALAGAHVGLLLAHEAAHVSAQVRVEARF